MKTIAFYNQKGGVGKTASAVTIAHMLAAVHNKRVIIVDLDAQANTSVFYSNVKVINYLKSLLLNEPVNKDEVGVSVEDLLIDSRLDIHKTIRHTKYKNLDIIPTFLTLSACENRLQADVTVPQQFRLKQHFHNIQDEYDYCVLDCSPSVSLVNINGLAMADKVYIPLKCDAYSACGMATVKQLIRTVTGYNPKLQLGGIFFTQWGNKRVDKTVFALLSKFIPKYIIPVKIPKSKLIEEISLVQQPLYLYDKGYKNKKTGKHENSHVTNAYLKLTDYILENA